jgi:hypothetical protein
VRRFGGALCALALGVAPLAAQPASSPSEIEKLYERGLKGDKAAVEECITKLETILRTEPKNQLARVYLGSAYTLRSRDMGFGPKKLQVLKQGVAVMDEAVAAAPHEPKVRLARALTTRALPAFLGYGSSARSDFLFLSAAAQRDPGKFERRHLQLVLYHGALAARKEGDRARAAALLREARRYPADAGLAQKVEAEAARP